MEGVSSESRSHPPPTREPGGRLPVGPRKTRTLSCSSATSDRRGAEMAKNEDIEVQVHEGRPVGMTVSLRLKPEDAELLGVLSRRHGMTVSETLRLAIHSLASSTDYRTLKVQNSGLGSFTRATI